LMKVEFTTIYVEIPQSRGAQPYVEEPQSLPPLPAISGPEESAAPQSEKETEEMRKVQSPEEERRRWGAESSEDQSPSWGQGGGSERSPLVAPLDPETVAWDEGRRPSSLWTPSKSPIKKIPRVDLTGVAERWRQLGGGRLGTLSAPDQGPPEGGRRADGPDKGAYEPREETSAALESEEDEAKLLADMADILDGWEPNLFDILMGESPSPLHSTTSTGHPIRLEDPANGGHSG
ncbi:hypothetical protein AWZ03_015211, partial [Drosophila navojoa]